MSGGYGVETRVGRVAGGEIDNLWLPRGKRTGRRGVVLLHGANQNDQWLSPANDASQWGQSVAIAAAIARAGIPCVSGDMGGGNTMGNDTAVARIASGWSLLQSAAGCAADKVCLVGVSMGAMNAIRFAQANPSQVAGIVGILPGVDPNDVYVNNRGGFRAQIGTAWGVTYPTALPTRAQLSLPENEALCKDVPQLHYYSTADTTILPATVTAYAAATGATATVCDTTSGHTATSVGKVPTVDVVAFLIANGA